MRATFVQTGFELNHHLQEDYVTWKQLPQNGVIVLVWPWRINGSLTLLRTWQKLG